MEKISKYKRILILLVLCIGALFAVYYFAYKELVKKNQSNASLVEYIALESDRENYIDQTQKQLLGLDPKIKKVQKIVVSSGDAASFIGVIESLAKENGITIKNDSVDEDVDTKLSSEITFLRIRSSTSGSWVGTYRFVAALETLPNNVKINNFRISNSAALLRGTGAPQDSFGEWNTKFEIVVLKRK